jgi:hypothetical protein
MLHSLGQKLFDEAPASAKVSSFHEEQALPLVIEPTGSQVDLIEWTRENADFIKKQLSRFGGLLLRNFAIDGASFERFVNASSSGALPYMERSSPRTKVDGNIYTSTDYPPDLPIFPHNEQSYNKIFPLKIYFMCAAPSETRGATPICDTRRIFHRIDPAIRRIFSKKKYMYVRKMGWGLGLHWRDVFQTDSRKDVEAYCLANGIEHEWLEDDKLCTRQIRDVISKHPETGELCWFNHLTFFHPATLPEVVREVLLSVVDEDDLPKNLSWQSCAAHTNRN